MLAFIVSCCAGSVMICWYSNAAALAGSKDVVGSIFQPSNAV
ncbi:MAG: hypothetical protein WC379_18535 [Methanoregula sp.]